MDRKRPPTFSVDGLSHGMGFSDFARERSAPADCFRCKVRRDSRASGARGAAPCTERSDAKQPGHSGVRAVCLAERTYSHQEIEVRPLFQSSSNSFLVGLQALIVEICSRISGPFNASYRVLSDFLYSRSFSASVSCFLAVLFFFYFLSIRSLKLRCNIFALLNGFLTIYPHIGKYRLISPQQLSAFLSKRVHRIGKKAVAPYVHLLLPLAAG